MPINVSVVMSVHNDQSFVSKAIAGILNQTMADFELIIIDDGSTDKSVSEIKMFEDMRIRFFEQPNSGLAQSLNFGIKVAQGKYIARQDSDDFSKPIRLEYQMNFLDAHPEIGLVGCGVVLIDENGQVLTQTNHPKDDATIQNHLMNNALGNPFVHGAVMFRRSLALEVGGYRSEFRQAQDLDMWLRIAEKTKLANLSIQAYYWRLRKNGVGNRNWENQRDFGMLARRCAILRRSGCPEPELSLLQVQRSFPRIMLSKFRFVDPVTEYNFKLAQIMFDAGMTRTVRTNIVKVLQHNPFHMYAWLLLGLSFFPRRIACFARDRLQIFYRKLIWRNYEN